MDAKIALDHRAVIEKNGAILSVFRPDGSAAFELTTPEGGAFYLFAEHVVHGQCPIVSFDQANKINGWMDWYYLVDVANGSMERLNPWR